MHDMLKRLCWLPAFFVGGALLAAQAPSQPAPGQPGQAPAAAGARGGMRGGPQVVSPQIESDGRVTFRILAPNATSVTVGGTSTGPLCRTRLPKPHRRWRLPRPPRPGNGPASRA